MRRGVYRPWSGFLGVAGAADASRHRLRRAARLLAVATLLLAAAIPIASEAAPTRPTPATGGLSWAYGGTAEAAQSLSDGNVEIGYTDASNYAVVLNESSDGQGGILLEVTRVLGTSGYFAACYPNCTHPIQSIRATSSGYEFETAVVDLVPNGTVDVNATSVPAMAIAGESLELSGNLTVRFLWSNLSTPGDPHVEWFNGSTRATTNGSFVARQALGLVPAAPTPGEGWNGSGSYATNASTFYEGAIGYQGNMIAPFRTPYAGTVTPISPMAAAIGGYDGGSPKSAAISGDAALSLVPADQDTNVLEGVLLIPNSAYLFAGFSPACDLAQRACLADAATPELDYNASATAHVGLDAAVSSISAFACWFDGTSVGDTPNGNGFWLPASGLSPTGNRGNVPVSAATVRTVTGLPIPVVQAEAIQSAWHPANGSGAVGPVAHPNPVPPAHTDRHPGGPAPGNVGPILALPGTAGAAWAVPLAIGAAGATVVALLLATGRRRRGPRRPPESDREVTPATPPEAGGEPSDEPMGYAW